MVAVGIGAVAVEGLVAIRVGSCGAGGHKAGGHGVWWPWKGWGLVAMGVLNMGLVAVSGESVAMHIGVVAMKMVTLRVVAIGFGGHGGWVAGQGVSPFVPRCPPR